MLSQHSGKGKNNTRFWENWAKKTGHWFTYVNDNTLYNPKKPNENNLHIIYPVKGNQKSISMYKLGKELHFYLKHNIQTQSLKLVTQHFKKSLKPTFNFFETMLYN
jgi:hypothetical protein